MYSPNVGLELNMTRVTFATKFRHFICFPLFMSVDILTGSLSIRSKEECKLGQQNEQTGKIKSVDRSDCPCYLSSAEVKR